MVVSIVMGVPPVLIHCPFLDGISPNKNNPAIGYPHDYGNPHVFVEEEPMVDGMMMNQQTAGI